MAREKLFSDILDENPDVKKISQALIVLIKLAEAEIDDHGCLYYLPHFKTIMDSIKITKKLLKKYLRKGE